MVKAHRLEQEGVFKLVVLPGLEVHQMEVQLVQEAAKVAAREGQKVAQAVLKAVAREGQKVAQAVLEEAAQAVLEVAVQAVAVQVENKEVPQGNKAEHYHNRINPSIQINGKKINQKRTLFQPNKSAA